MLVLMDRNFLAFELVQAVIERKVQFLIRATKNRVLRIHKLLSDGAYLSRIYANQSDQQKDRKGIDVRVIEYPLNDPDRTGCGDVHRLVTSLLDADKHPALVLIVLYHERWEEELAFDELKTHLRGRPVLRSQRPDGVRQEIYVLLIAHFIIHKVIVDASIKAGVEPTRISITATLKIVKSKHPEVPMSSSKTPLWYQLILAEVATEILPPRSNCINPRALKKTTSAWTRKRNKH